SDSVQCSFEDERRRLWHDVPQHAVLPKPVLMSSLPVLKSGGDGLLVAGILIRGHLASYYLGNTALFLLLSAILPARGIPSVSRRAWRITESRGCVTGDKMARRVTARARMSQSLLTNRCLLYFLVQLTRR